MHIEPSGLIAALKEAPEGRSSPPCEVCDYVLEHIYRPLLRDKPVFFADLDFEAFTIEDIDDLIQWLEQRERTTSCLCKLGMVFCNAAPVSRPDRAFC